jgi:hypothetical protein
MCERHLRPTGRDLTASVHRDSFRASSIVGQAMRCVRALGLRRCRTAWNVDLPCEPNTLIHHLVSPRSWLALSLPLLLARVALASEAVLAAPAPAVDPRQAAASVPLVLGAPPAWVVMAIGVAVVSVTVYRRVRKAALQRVRR